MSYLLGLGECVTDPITGVTTCSLPKTSAPAVLDSWYVGSDVNANAMKRFVDEERAAMAAQTAAASPVGAAGPVGSVGRSAPASSGGGGGFLDTLKSIFSFNVSPNAFQTGYDRGYQNVAAAYSAPAVVPRGFDEMASATDSALRERLSIIRSMSSDLRRFNAPQIALPQPQIDWAADYESSPAGGVGRVAVVVGVLAVVALVIRAKPWKKK